MANEQTLSKRDDVSAILNSINARVAQLVDEDCNDPKESIWVWQQIMALAMLATHLIEIKALGCDSISYISGGRLADQEKMISEIRERNSRISELEAKLAAQALKKKGRK